MPADPSTESRVLSNNLLAAAAGLALLAVVVACGSVSLWWARSNRHPAAGTASATAAAKVPGDPWPECALVRAWLRDNTGDPASIEVIEWINRYEYPPGSPDPGAIVVSCRFRGVNSHGGKSVETRLFHIKDGKVDYSYAAN